MKTTADGSILTVSEIGDLSLECASSVRDEIRTQFGDGLTSIAVDLSDTGFIDSSGLGTLVALHKSAVERGGGLQILHPNPQTLQILELTRLHRVFEITT